jgi:hypothetical protein
MIRSNKDVAMLTSVGAIMLMLALPVLGTAPAAKTNQRSGPMNSSHESTPAPVLGKAEPKTPSYEGTILDLHCYMTRARQSGDFAKTVTQELKAGVPAILETPKGAILLAPETGKKLEPLADFGGQYVRIEGRMWERGGLKYLEYSSIAKETKPQAAAHSKSFLNSWFGGYSHSETKSNPAPAAKHKSS